MRNGRSHTQHPVSGAWDAIVIGSGIGGLAVAGLLARHAGKRVLVLERHYTAGGFTHAFTRRGFEWDVGVHYIGQVERPSSPLRRLFDHLSDGNLEWEGMGEVYDTLVFGGERYPLPCGHRNFRELLASRFPDEIPAIDAYLRRTRAAVRDAGGFFADKLLPDLLSRSVGRALRRPALRHTGRTVAAVFAELGVSPRLGGVLAGQWGDYGLPPAQASFFMHATVVQHYLGGASYPVGGAGRIAATFIPGIERAGGAVVTSAEVERILVRAGRVAGVRLVDGTELTAPTVISDAGWALTANHLLAPEDAVRAGLTPLPASLAPSCAHVSLYVGARGDAAELGLARSNLWIYPGHDHDAQVARYLADPEAPLPVAYLSFPSAKDPDFARRHPGKATVEVVGLVPYAWFAGWEGTRWKRRGADYEALKARLAERLLEVLLRECPTLRGRIEHAELSTPLSTRNFAAHPHGEVYGLAHVPARFAIRALRPATRLPGLFLTGADVCTAGVGGALLGGALTAGVVARGALLRAVAGALRAPGSAAPAAGGRLAAT
jgi:all-trans-retinol 13,14-reductase